MIKRHRRSSAVWAPTGQGVLRLSLGLLVFFLVGFPLLSGSVFPSQAQADRGVVNVYSARHYGQMEPVFRRFMEETGIEVRFTFGKDAELRERIQAEGRFTLADVYIGVDAGNLWLAAREGILQPIPGEVVAQNIPEQFRDPDEQWTALTLRLRTIVYAPDRVDPAELSTYEALADPKWRGRLCLRPATHVYTQSLVASLIAAHGVERAEEIVRGWVENTPSENFIDSDTRILQTLAAGGCDVGIVNDYYLARLLYEDPSFPVRLFWANQGEGERGVHANVSGAGLVKYARNVENAIALIEWLTQETGQRLLADGNFEHPANPRVGPHPLLQGFGIPRIDPVPVWRYGEFQAEAIELMNRVGHP